MICQLFLYDLSGLCFLDYMFRKTGRITDPCCEKSAVGILPWLYDPHDLQVFPLVYQIIHVFFVICLISPDLILVIIFIVICAVYQFKGDPQDILIGISSHIFRDFYVFFIDKLTDHVIQLHRIPQSHGIQHKITDTSPGCQDQHTLIVIFRPASCLYIILIHIQVGIFRHLIKHIRAHHRRHHAAGTAGRTKPQSFKRAVRIYPADIIIFLEIDLRYYIIGVFNGVGIFLNIAVTAVQIFFQRLQVIGVHGRKHICDHIDDIDISGLFLLLSSGSIPGKHRRKIHSRTLDLKGIFR